VNQALRTGDPDLIHPHRFFINDLYSELLSIHRQDIGSDEEDFVTCRGQGLTQPELTSLQSSVGQLVTFASFISTTVDRELAYGYARTSARENVVPAFFEFHMNTQYDNTRPYAYVGNYSAIPDEYEVLISVGTIFRLISVAQNLETGIWCIVLSLCQQHNNDIKHLIPTKRGRRKIKFVKFCPSPSPVELTFHETLKTNLLSKRRSLSSIRTRSLPTSIISESEKENLHIRRRRSLPLVMSQNTLDLQEMNWGEKPEDCGLFNSLKRKTKSDPDLLISLFRRPPIVQSSLPNLSSIKLSDIYAKTAMIMFNPLISLIQCASIKRCSLPNLSNINFTASQAKFAVMKWKIERNDHEMNDHERNDSMDDSLFHASIYRTLMLFTEQYCKWVTESTPLKEEAELARRYMKHNFNINHGRWCDEY
jgi:hypothetical protein